MDKTGSGQAYDIGCIDFLGFKEAVIVTFLRVFLGSILVGTILGPTFFSEPRGRYCSNTYNGYAL